MSAAKSERLMNLLIMLLVQRRYATKDTIRRSLYPGMADEAFEKMFERDKDELRSLGAPVEVVQGDPLFEDDMGYRIRPDDFQLPEVTFAPEEAAIIGVATRVWDHAGYAQAASSAGRKLAAEDGGDVDLQLLDKVLPRINAEEPSYDAFSAAASTRTPVRFDYGRPGQSPASRLLEPWGVVRYSGRWYVVGRDVDRDDARVFRLSRVLGVPVAAGPSEAFRRPEDVDAAAIVRRLAPAPQESTCELLVRPGTGHILRRHGDVIGTGAGPDGELWDRPRVSGIRTDVAGEIMSHGPDVVVLAPAELRAEVVARLSSALVGS